jgi:hypothetical protein
MATSTKILCVCCGAGKSKIYSFTSKKCQLFQTELIVASIFHSNRDLSPLKSKHICDNCVKSLCTIQTIKDNISKACNAASTEQCYMGESSTSPVEPGKRPARTPQSLLKSGQTKRRSVVDQLVT